MTIRTVLNVIVFSACLNSASGDDATPRQVLEAWSNAWRTGKPEAMMKFYADSPKLIAVASSGHSYKGRAEVEKMYRSAFDEATWESVRLQRLELEETDEGAWASCRFVADIIDRASGKKLTFTSQGTIVMRREDGEWKIALEHFSPIEGEPRVKLREE